MKILVVGLGSIGKRRLRDLYELGVEETILIDADQAKLLSPLGIPLSEKVLVGIDIGEALRLKPDAALICTPPASHLPFALECAKAGCHLFIEKPLSNSMKGVEELREVAEAKNLIVQVGFSWRFHPGLMAFREKVAQEPGSLLFLSIEGASHLPTWRNGDYRLSYSASEAEGGVVLDCCSHAFDLARWLLKGLRSGKVTGEEFYLTDLKFKITRTGYLEIGGEDSVTVLAIAGWGTHVVIHENYLTKEPLFRISAIGTERTAQWQDNGDRSMYREELRRFLNNICQHTQSGEQPLPNLEDGIESLRLCLEVKKCAL